MQNKYVAKYNGYRDKVARGFDHQSITRTLGIEWTDFGPGKRIYFSESRVFSQDDDEEKLIATAMVTLAVIEP